jgi:hypothetical protein
MPFCCGLGREPRKLGLLLDIADLRCITSCRTASGIGRVRFARPPYFIASYTAWVHAPVGFLVITGSEPPASSVATVRS